MKVQRLIEKYKELYKNVFDFGAKLACQLILQDLEQLDEPEKIKIPQFVADWLSNLKSGLFGLNYDSVSSEIYDWVYAAEDNLRKLHLAFVFGYEVEEEKRYTVVMKETKQPLYYNAGDKKLFFSLGGLATKFTRKQLEEAGFGWVFDCEGIEVEEVE